MASASHQLVPGLIGPATGPRPVHLVYVRPVGDSRHFEARLLEIVSHFGNRVRFTRARPSELSRFTRERVFLSPTVPNVVLVRDGEVVAQAVGKLPARDIEQLIRGATAERAG
jgi:hypothetical protein